MARTPAEKWMNILTADHVKDYNRRFLYNTVCSVNLVLWAFVLCLLKNMLFCGESYTADENCLNVLVDFVSSSLFNVLSMKISEWKPI